MDSNKKKLAIFDIDGTIFRKNLAFELIDELVWMKVFPRETRKKLIHLYARWLEHKGTYEEYRDAIVKLYQENLTGHSKEEILRASRAVIPFYKDRTYVYSNRLIEKFKKENYNIIAISGSPIEIVEEFNKHLQFDEVFGTVYEMNDEEKYTGKIVFAPVIHKGHTVEQYLTENNLELEGSYGMGDTESDAKFLEIVENPIAFNPNLNLKKIAKKNGWKIVVEKKDVIYQIN